MNDDKIKQLQALIELDPEDTDLPYLLGKALLDAGKYGEAAEYLATAARKNPRLAAVRRSWGEALREAGRFKEAIQAWDEGIAISQETGDLQAGKTMKVFLKRLKKSIDDGVNEP